MKTPNQAIALVQIPDYQIDFIEITGGLSLYLDGVQDPGNWAPSFVLPIGLVFVMCCADTAAPTRLAQKPYSRPWAQL